LAGELRKLHDRVPAGAWPVGVGVAVPGLVRRADGYIEHAPNLTWRNVAFGRMVGERLGLVVPLRIGNDGDVGALAEHVRGAGRGVDNMIYMAGDVGLGGGLIVDGRMVHGAGGYAGEIGHVLVNPGGRQCRCGSAGCLETEVGEDAVLVAAGLSPGSGRAATSEVLRRARAADPTAVAAVEHVAQWLGRGIANLVNIFNPELVLVGGALSTIFTAAEPVVRGEYERFALGVSRQQVRVAVPELGEDSLLLGAAELAFEALLHDPVVEWWRPGG
jgi:predicted NBD/HSP70 family sugar kinase